MYNILYIIYNMIYNIYLKYIYYILYIYIYIYIDLMANWVSVALPDSDDPLSSDHFPFAFKTRNPKTL